jgi:oxygen-dependent protoporphyrinogen oxidase
MVKEPFRTPPNTIQTIIETTKDSSSTSTTVEDESIRAFISRRFSSMVADRIVSAMVSGIYAGDISELSARACFGRLWHMERKYGSIIRGLWSTRNDKTDVDAQRIQRELLDPTRT